MRIAVGSDGITALTDGVLAELRRRGLEVELFGALKEGAQPDWPSVAFRVGERVFKGVCHQGLLFCWTGTGVSIAANKIPGVRAALCTDAFTAAGARRWNDANVLCLSLRLTSLEVAKEIIEVWFSTEAEPSEKGNIDQVKNRDMERAKLLEAHKGA